jgi:hypothetical protein
MYLSDWKDELNDMDKSIDYIELSLMKPDIGSGVYWCNKIQEFIENTKDDCGKHCVFYKPLNCKWGRCMHLKHSLTETGKVFRLYRDGKLEEVKIDR